MVIDSRRLLGAPSAGVTGVVVHWQSRDGQRRAALCVDGVDGLSDDNDRDVLRPRVRRTLDALFSGVVHDRAGMFRLQLRRDAALDLDRPGQRRLLAKAVLGLLPTND